LFGIALNSARIVIRPGAQTEEGSHRLQFDRESIVNIVIFLMAWGLPIVLTVLVMGYLRPILRNAAAVW